MPSGRRTSTSAAAPPCDGGVPDDEVHLVARVVEVAGSRPHEDVHLGQLGGGLDERGARGEAAVGHAGAQLDARGAGPGGDPDAIDRLDTDLDAHEVLSFGSLCESLHPATIHLAARTRAGTRPALKSGEAD